MAWSKNTLPPSVKDKGWDEAQIEHFVSTANAILQNTGNEAEAIAAGIKQADERHNASQMPRMFYARHMQPGICAYDDEVVLVDTDALKKMLPTAIGLPVYVLHDLNTKSERLKNLDKDAVGYITESFYNEMDGWAWFKFLIVKDEGHAAIRLGWAVSNAYIGRQRDKGGSKNNCPYSSEVLNGEFTHLAIVPDPRYEDACIMTPEEFRNYQDLKKQQLEELHNSKPIEKEKPMFKLFKTTKEEVKNVDADTMVELENGSTVSIKEMVNAMRKNSADEDKKKKEMENGDMDVDVGGEKMPLKELVNRYCAMNEKKNSEDEEEKKKKEKEEAEKKNAADEEDKKKKEKEEEEKKNSLRNFDELRNAHMNGKEPVMIIETSLNKLERGKARYGSAS